MSIVEAIDARIGEVRAESLDMSVGEIIALHQQNELVIQPDFQRLFRWSTEQRSRLVESLLLELPIPSIFVIEKENGVLELIDGLQRISSLLHFIAPSSLTSQADDEVASQGEMSWEAVLETQIPQDTRDIDEDVPEELIARENVTQPLVLSGCDLVEELNGMSFETLPLTLRLRLKRTPIRAVIIKRQSSQFLRYEMFKRLNTGGSKLSDQDIRNVNARMLGEVGALFYRKIARCANFPSFRETVSLLPEAAIESRMHEELVLRFFASKNYRAKFRGNVGDWLDSYMEEILLGKKEFVDRDIRDFVAVFNELAAKFGSFAFVKYRGSDPVGGVAPAYFEAVTMGVMENLDKFRSLNPDVAKHILATTVQSKEFRRVTGPGANSLPKLEERIRLLSTAIATA